MNNEMPESERSQQLMEEAEQTLRAIQYGTVDAFVVEEPEGHRVYTLEGADLPYSTLVEKMQQGAAMLDARGCYRLLQSQSGTVTWSGARDGHRALLAGLRCFRGPARLPEIAARESDRIERRRNAAASRRRQSHPHKFLLQSFVTRQIGNRSSGHRPDSTRSNKWNLRRAFSACRMRSADALARELHDSVGQTLAAISMNIGVVQAQSHKLDADRSQSGFRKCQSSRSGFSGDSHHLSSASSTAPGCRRPGLRASLVCGWLLRTQQY